MVTINVSDALKDVRVCLDENDVQSTLEALMTENTLMLDDIIKSKIGDAVNAVSMSAPVELLGNGKEFADHYYVEGDEVEGAELKALSIVKPADYLRLIRAKMPDWDYEVSDTISVKSAEYRQQKSRFAGLRGNPQRPVVADTGTSIELFTSYYDKVQTLDYVPRVDAVTDTFEISSKALSRAIVYQIAGLTCATLKEADHAQTLFALAEGVLSVSNETKGNTATAE